MALPISCPTRDQLEEVMRGKLTTAESEQIARHVESCPLCEGTLQSLSSDDTFTEFVRSEASKPGAGIDPRVRELISRLQHQDRTANNARPEEPGLQTQAFAESPRAGAGALDFLAPAQQPDEIGRLAHYRVLQVLGKGGMGVVLQAHDLDLDRMVALKVMLPGIAANPSAKQRFLREARAAAKLRSDHIVTVYQVSEFQQVPYLAMEYLEGSPLDQFLANHRELSIGQILRIGRQIASGLADAHERGLIHRDIKPGNVWLDSAHDGRAKILDFGLARFEGDDIHITQSGAIVGTPAYMAPEQARGDKATDARADLFSLGCVLYRLCAGDIPFKADTTMGVLLAIAQNQPEIPLNINKQIPPPLSELIMQLLEKDPARRPASARVVIDRLAAMERSLTSAPDAGIQANLGVHTAPRNPTLDPGVTRSDIALPSRPRRPLLSVWLVLGALLLVGAGFAVYQLYFDTPNGRIVVQIDDDDIEARFKKGKIELYDKLGKLLYTLEPGQRNKELPPGNYGIKVAGVDGLELDTDTFEMKRNGKVIVRVLLDRAALAKVGGKKEPVIKEVKHAPPPGDYALRFDGGQRVDLPTMKLDAAVKKLTIEAWVTVDADTKNYTARIVGNSKFGLDSTVGSNGAISLGIRGGAGGGQNTNQGTKNRTRHHLAGVFDGTRYTIFLDGVNKGATPPTKLWGIDDPWDIGSKFKGVIDEIRVSKVARYTKDFTPAHRFEPDADTLALYHFDEGQGDKLTDSSGNGHHGKIVGAKWVKADRPAVVAPVPVRYALEFDGVENHVEIPTLLPPTPQPLTIEAYLAPRAVKGSGAVIRFFGPKKGLITIQQQNGSWAGYAGMQPERDQVTAKNALRAGQPDHVALTWDGKSAPILYVNGVRYADQPNTINRAGIQRGLYLGGYWDKELGSLRRFFAGRIREVRVSKSIRYDKNFTPLQRFEPDSDTLALYHFDEGAGDVLKDSSGNGHHGKIVGAKWVKADGTPIAPPVQHSLSFDKNSRVTVPSLSIDLTQPGTLEGYVTQQDLNGQNTNLYTHDAIAIRGENKFWTIMANVDDPKGKAQWIAMPSAIPVGVGRKTHLALVFDGRGDYRLYVDGALATRKDLSKYAFGSRKKVLEMGFAFIGLMSEVRVSKVTRYDKDFTPLQRFEPDADTLALYHFDEGQGEVLRDSSGNGHHGKIVGAKWVKADGASIAPPSNFAAEFDGATTHAEVRSLQLGTEQPITIEARVKFAKGAGPLEVIASTYNPKTALLLARTNEGSIVFLARRDLESKFTGLQGEVSDDVWTHLAGVWDGKNARLYINGKLHPNALTKPVPQAMAAIQKQPLIIGAERGLPGLPLSGFLRGQIDALRISKIARYDKEFTPGTSFDSDPNTLALYQFNEDAGDKLVDSSGNGHHGQIVGAKWIPQRK